MIFCFLIKSYDFWLINYLFGFNIKDNEIRYYNFDIVPCYELSILLLLRESHCYSNLKLGVFSSYHGLCLYICSLY